MREFLCNRSIASWVRVGFLGFALLALSSGAAQAQVVTEFSAGITAGGGPAGTQARTAKAQMCSSPDLNGGLQTLTPSLARGTPISAKTGPADEERLRQRIGGVGIPFIVNRGQTDPAVAYYAPTFAGTVYVTREGEIVYSFPGRAEDGRDSPGPSGRAAVRAPRVGWTLTETPAGGRARPMGEERAATGVSFFIGNDPARWKTGVATYDSVTLGEVWPGVDVRLRAHGRNAEKLFVVHPGAQLSSIRMRVAGARSLRANAAGALVATTALGEVTFTSPVAYQEREGVRRAVAVAYRTQGQEYGFSVGSYDPALPVVIDPLLQATYLGGSGVDEAFALAIHPTSGDVYVAGATLSTNFPGTAGGAQPANGGGTDAFVARLNAALTTLNQATYLGGSGSEEALALAIHPTSGDVYVAGETLSTDFPGTAGGAQPANGGSPDAFVARLNAALTTLNQATYLGGGGGDLALALAIHPTSGEVYVAGETTSTNFPGTAGGAQPANGGVSDAFVARLTADLAGPGSPTPTPTPTVTASPTPTNTPVGVPTPTPTVAPGVVVPTLSSPMLGLLALSLALIALLLMKRL
jgi:hypothetical protein